MCLITKQNHRRTNGHRAPGFRRRLVAAPSLAPASQSGRLFAVTAVVALTLSLSCTTSAPTSHGRRKAVRAKEAPTAASDDDALTAATPKDDDEEPRVAKTPPSVHKGPTKAPSSVGKVPQAAGQGPPAMDTAKRESARTACMSLETTFGTPYRTLRQHLSPSVAVPEAFAPVLSSTPPATVCAEAPGRMAFVRSLRDLVTLHGGRIGLLLPLSGAGNRSSLATYVVQGLRASVAEQGLNFDQVFVVKDTAGNTAQHSARLAELVFSDRVAMVIGGFDPSEAKQLAQAAAELQLPTILLSRDRTLTATGGFSFLVYPDEQKLASTLAEAVVRRGLKRIAMLRPVNGKSDKVAGYFREALVARGGQLTVDLPYTPGNFESMTSTIKRLVQADQSARSGEFRQAYLAAKRDAERQGQPFDARQVVLRPIIDFDALFIPDDFRTIRHFAKLLRFHLVDRLTLIGNHEWRSPGLIDPYEEFLDGSMFADFVGTYASLPQAVGAPTIGSPYFVDPQNVVPVDFRLIGYRAGKVVTKVLSAKPVKRRDVMVALGSATGDGAGFPQGPLFDHDQRSNWPTYLFTIHKRQLSLLPGPVP